MLSTQYYLATALPALGELGTSPPLLLSDFRAKVSETSAAAIVDVILLGDDLRQRQAVLAGELAEPLPAVLSQAEAKGQAPLPDFLARSELVESLRPSDDLIWESYWHHVAHVAHVQRSAFLRAWARMEVAVRNGVAAARARSLAQPAHLHLVAPDLGEEEQLVELGIAEWAGAADPLAGLRSLLQTRWDWVAREEPRFSFDDDELAAYAVRLILLRDWRRTMGVAA